MVLPIPNLFPGRKREPGHVGGARLHPDSVVPLVGADDLDVHVRDPRVGGGGLPLAPRELDGIAGVGYHAPTQMQIVGRDAVGEAIPLASNVRRAEIAQRLLDGVDPQIGRSELRGQGSCQGGLPRAGKAGEDVERLPHGHCGSADQLRVAVEGFEGLVPATRREGQEAARDTGLTTAVEIRLVRRAEVDRDLERIRGAPGPLELTA